MWSCFVVFLTPYIAFPIVVTITSTIDSTHGPVYSPGSSVQLNCSAEGTVGAVSTNWNSTCSGNCFVLQQSTPMSIRKEILHSTDTGNHTCTVSDDVGNSGVATIEMRISGTYFVHK